jgi:tRNA(Ile)-lysidine synthase
LEQVRATVLKFSLFAPGDRVLVGVSGGADSVALFHLLFRLREDFKLTLFTCHLNHMFRGEEARLDAEWVAALAGSFDIPSVIESFDVPAHMTKYGLSAQTAARQVRYDFYLRTAGRLGAGRVALGHHADDQAETVLINLIRGAGSAGLKGIPPVRDNFYIRPLIETRRSRIEAYCSEYGLSYRQDSSNLKKLYTRNRVRLELMPLLEEKYNPAIVASLNRLAGILREEDEYLEAAAANELDKAIMQTGPGLVMLALERLENTPLVLKRRLLRIIYRKLAGDQNAPDFGHIENALGLLENCRLPGRLEWPGGITLLRRYGGLEFAKEGARPEVPCYCYQLNIPGSTCVPETGTAIEARIKDIEQIVNPKTLHPGEAFLDYDRLFGPVKVRRRKDGDLFWPLGFKGTIKLKKFFIDRKVPRELRSSIPLVVSGDDEIVWVAGLRPGDKWKITAATKRCLHLKLIAKYCQ